MDLLKYQTSAASPTEPGDTYFLENRIQPNSSVHAIRLGPACSVQKINALRSAAPPIGCTHAG